MRLVALVIALVALAIPATGSPAAAPPEACPGPEASPAAIAGTPMGTPGATPVAGEAGTPAAATPVAAEATPTVPAASPVAGAAITDRAELAAALRARGVEVRPLARVEQPFLRAAVGRAWRLCGGGIDRRADVFVFEYARAGQAERDAATISPEGQPQQARISWVDTPHFWRQGKLIVLYVGSDAAVVAVLTDLLGPPFAGPGASA